METILDRSGKKGRLACVLCPFYSLDWSIIDGSDKLIRCRPSHVNGNVMRKPLRPFVREYKGRSSRFLIEKEMLKSTSHAAGDILMEGVTTKPVPQDFGLQAVFQAADAMFCASTEHPMPVKPERVPKLGSGRVLPCLLQQFNHLDDQPEKVRRARRRAVKAAVAKASDQKSKIKNEHAPSKLPAPPKERLAESEKNYSERHPTRRKKWAQTQQLGPGQKWKRRLSIYAR